MPLPALQTPTAARPKILVTRAIFPEVLAALAEHCDVEANTDDALWSTTELVQRLQGKAGVLTMPSDAIGAEVLQQCPNLRVCANMAVGFNNFDLAAMTAAGVQATNTPDVLTESTADFGFALLLAAARRVAEAERYLRAGQWKTWRYDLLAGVEVHGSTLGIVGMGRIGQAIARRAYAGFGMRVIYHNRSRLDAATEADLGATYMTKDDLLRHADHVMLVVPYSAQSHHCIAAPELALMKPTATLINIARGGVVDDAALAQALATGQIAAAGLDVYEGEPAVHPGLLAVPNVVLTPHIASATVGTRKAMAQLAADNLIAYLTRGVALNPLNALVNAPVSSNAYPSSAETPANPKDQP